MDTAKIAVNRKREHVMKNIVETILGAIVLVVAIGFLFFAYKTTNLNADKGYELTANFSQIDGLEIGSAVKVAGIKVGKILDLKIDPQTYSAIVVMDVDKDIKLPLDTAAVISSSGMLGGKFMSLEPGADEEFLEPGDKIEYTQSVPSLEKLLGQVIFSMNKSEK